MKTELQTLIGLELPIIQAPMAGVQGSELAIAVSKAGGLGSLPCAMLNSDAIRSELQRIEANTSRPYNVNFFCHKAPNFDAKREARWRETLAPYYQEFDINPNDISAGASRAPFNHELADVLEGFKPAVVSFHFGLPEKPLLARVKALGAKVLASATSVKEAQWLAAHGADIIVAQGVEAGGHRGIFLWDEPSGSAGQAPDYSVATQIGTFALLPQIVKAVDVPVIAAGGLADTDGIKAAMTLGASGVQLGTSYLLCDEAKTSAVHRAALKSEHTKDTALTNVFSGRPARSIVNRLVREQGPMSTDVPAFPMASTATAPLRAKAEANESGDFSPLWCGQNASGCQEISATKLTQNLAEAFKS
ncbi:MAG: NAD(P)H-dependent flavin oxidoreductase [Leucothrix sp.]